MKTTSRTARIKLTDLMVKQYDIETKGQAYWTASLVEEGNRLYGAEVRFGKSKVYFAYGANEFELA